MSALLLCCFQLLFSIPLLIAFAFASTDGEEEEDDGGEDDDDDEDALQSLADDMEEEEEEEEELKPPAEVSTTRSVASKPATYSSSFNQSTSNRGIVESSQSSFGDWRPIFLKTVYIDANLIQHQVVLLCLPGGVGSKRTEGVEVKLSEGYLCVTVQWPEWLTTQAFFPSLRHALVKVMSKAWIGLPEDEKLPLQDQYHENCILMQHAIKSTMAAMRPTSASPLLTATTRIQLDIEVRANISDDDWHFLGDLNGVRLLFVDLKAPQETVYEKPKVKSVQLALQEVKLEDDSEEDEDMDG